MKIIYTKHALDQIKIRTITKKAVREIYSTPDFYCFDIFEENYVAVKQILYSEKLRFVAVSFNHETDHDKIVTVKPEKENNLLNKIRKGRWIKL